MVFDIYYIFHKFAPQLQGGHIFMPVGKETIKQFNIKKIV
jgi:hypothetical protein